MILMGCMTDACVGTEIDNHFNHFNYCWGSLCHMVQFIHINLKGFEEAFLALLITPHPAGESHLLRLN